MIQFGQKMLNPAQYHGHGRGAPFFEGWYYKMVSADEAHRYAIIPGVFLGAGGYAFVQVLDGSSGKAEFNTYDLSDFWAAQDRFELRIGPNQFMLDHIQLDIIQGQDHVIGELCFTDVQGWPVTLFSPGIMGWYAWVPFMECYHGVLGFDHAVSGELVVNNEHLDFSGGRGYIEKDWGKAFPSAYIWMQTNHFELPGVCLTASVALIPWLGRTFRGFIVGLWREGELQRFATYTGAHIEHLALDDEKVVWVLTDHSHRLEIEASRAHAGLLKGPTRREMEMRVAESLQSTVQVRLTQQDGTLLFEGKGRHAGLEAVGDLNRLVEAK
jgi:hypothetical protein